MQQNSIEQVGWHRHVDFYLTTHGSELKSTDLEHYLKMEPRPQTAWLQKKFGVKDWRTMAKWVKKYDEKGN